MLRIYLVSAAALALAPLASMEAQTRGFQPNTDRFGGTFKAVTADDPARCAVLCGENTFCLAWTFTRSLSVAEARCELKSTLGQPQPNPLKTSGISPRVEARYPAAEQESDYNSSLDGASEPTLLEDLPPADTSEELLTFTLQPLLVTADYSGDEARFKVTGKAMPWPATFFDY